MATIITTDVIAKTIGSFGKYQAQILFLIMLGCLQADYQLHNLVFILPKVDYVCMDENAVNVTNHCPCENPQYDQSEIISSVTSEWNLICDRTFLASLAQSMIQLGCFPGSFMSGYLSDRYGRKRIICVTLLFSSLLVSLSAVSPNIWTFIVIRLLSGFPVGGVMTCGYIFIVELTGTSHRTLGFVTTMSLNVICYFTISLISYFVRRWRYIQFIISAPWILTVAYFWIIPESPHWLITTGRTDEAIELLTKIAKRNGLPTDHIASTVYGTIKEGSKREDDQEKPGTFIDLFKSSKMRLYSISIAMLWTIGSHVNYGITQYVGRLQGNLYLNTMLSALFTTPAILLFIICTRYFKRKVGVVICVLITSTSLILFILTRNSLQYLNLAFIILALIGNNASYAQTHLLTSEIFPTIVRNSGFGFAAMSSRIGSFLAPFVVNIGMEWVTITIFIVLLLFAISLCYFLPETKGMVLQNTIEQTEILYGKKVSDKIHVVK